MNWVDQLQIASFRGVPFQVDGIDVSAGDHVVLREYPFQDLPTVFRMGEAAEEIKFSAYVIGEDYTDQREKLRSVLTGEGVLVHPTAGSIRVFVAGKFGIKENPTAEGGMARFDLTFVRAETRRYPAGVANTPQEAFRKAELAKQASADAFVSAFDLTGKPGWAADLAVARITESVAGVWGQIKSVTAGLGDFTNTIIGNYQALRDGLNSLVRTPRLLADALATLFTLPSDLSAAASRDFMAAFEGLFDINKRVTQRDFEVSIMPAVGAGLVIYGAGSADALWLSTPAHTQLAALSTASDQSAVGAGLVIYGAGSADALWLSTPARTQLAALSTASDQLIESLAVAGWVQAAAAAELSSYDDALTLRSTVNDQCTRLLLRASTQEASADLPTTVVSSAVGSSVSGAVSTVNGVAVPPWHDAMLGLMSASLRDLQERSRDMARLESFTPQGWMPVWAVSYRLFGTAAYADEILAMNPHITHPLLVPPGKPLRIMRRD